MSAMMLVTSMGWAALGREPSPTEPEFWFVMSMALLAGFVAAYPMNWWLVAKGLKHVMSRVREPAAAPDARKPAQSAEADAGHTKASNKASVGWPPHR